MNNLNLSFPKVISSLSEFEKVADPLNEVDPKPLPLLIWLIIISSGLALVGGEGILGYRISGLAWFIPLVFAGYVLIKNLDFIRFPVKIWIPWIILLGIHLSLSKYTSLQRTVQLLCPIVVGAAVSTLLIESSHIKEVINLIKSLSVFMWTIIMAKTGVLITGKIPFVTGLAAEAITAGLFCSIFSSSYASGRKKDFFWWGLVAVIPFYAVTRTAVFAAIVTLPFTFYPLPFRKRVFFVIITIILGLSLFYTPRIQNKMFRSGKGTILDVFNLTPKKKNQKLVFSKKLADHGRDAMWKFLLPRIRRSAWFGFGTGSTEFYVKKFTGTTPYPHNDWLLTLHDYGLFGTLIFVICILGTMLHALKTAKNLPEENRILFYAGAGSFIPFLIMMTTDNIMVYSSFFTNLQFTILGMAYGSARIET